MYIHESGFYLIRCRLQAAVFQPISEARSVNVIWTYSERN